MSGGKQETLRGLPGPEELVPTPRQNSKHHNEDKNIQLITAWRIKVYHNEDTHDYELVNCLENEAKCSLGVLM